MKYLCLFFFFIFLQLKSFKLFSLEKSLNDFNKFMS